MTTNSFLGELEARSPAGTQKTAASSSRATFIRWLKFNFVGGIGIIVQFAALFLLKGVFHLHYLFATAVAVEAAVVHNFVWHEQFTWVDRTKSGPVEALWRRSLLRFVRFNLTTGAVSILGNLGLMKILVGQGHMNYLLANGIAIVLCSLANFLVSDGWVFDGRH
jgi:putative flippase GtrA